MPAATPLPLDSRAGLPVRLVVVVGAAVAVAAQLSGCTTRAVDVLPTPTSATEFAAWPCNRIDDELDAVQQRAADVAYAVDERAGNNIIALGVGVTIFWPAMLAMRPEGLEAADLARLKGRFEALAEASRRQACAPRSNELAPDRAAALPVVLGERLVYEDRSSLRRPATEWALRLTALRRGELEYRVEPGAKVMPSAAPVALPATPVPVLSWRHDLAGNVLSAPEGSLQWQRLLRPELALGQVVAGDMGVAGDIESRARLRGQVVAVGPQTLAGRRFEVAVIELFGDTPRGEASTRVDGALVVDRRSGVLLRLDLRSAEARFSMQRRLVRIDAAGVN